MKNPRATIGSLVLSAASLIGIAVNEGYKDAAYVPTKGDVPTIGFGTTTRPDGTPVQLGDRTNPVEALQRKARDLVKFEGAVRQCVKVPLYQHEYDAYVDMAYNIGSGAFCASTLVRRLNAEDYAGACKAVLDFRYITDSTGGPGWVPYKWDAQGRPIRWKFDCSTPGNKVCAGLWGRRLATHKQCLGE
jgi:lysozyme